VLSEAEFTKLIGR